MMLAVSPREFVQTSRWGRWLALDARAVGLLDRVLLHEHPAVAAVPQRPDELVGDVGVVGQRHLGRREAAHAAERLEPEERREVVLPGPDVQAIVLHRGRGRDGVAPGAAEPLDRPAIAAGRR